jgi:hypothetical protein
MALFTKFKFWYLLLLFSYLVLGEDIHVLHKLHVVIYIVTLTCNYSYNCVYDYAKEKKCARLRYSSLPHSVPTYSEANQSSYSVGTRALPRFNAAEVWNWPHTSTSSRLRITGAIHPLPHMPSWRRHGQRYIYLMNEGTRDKPSPLRANVPKAVMQWNGAQNSIAEDMLIFSKDNCNYVMTATDPVYESRRSCDLVQTFNP